jgi:hypothetical protein
MVVKTLIYKQFRARGIQYFRQLQVDFAQEIRSSAQFIGTGADLLPASCGAARCTQAYHIRKERERSSAPSAKWAGNAFVVPNDRAAMKDSQHSQPSIAASRRLPTESFTGKWSRQLGCSSS